MTLRIRAKVLLHVWPYDFCDMTLSTESQRRHMINLCNFNLFESSISSILFNSQLHECMWKMWRVGSLVDL